MIGSNKQSTQNAKKFMNVKYLEVKLIRSFKKIEIIAYT